MIPTNLDCASLVSVRIRDLKRVVSWLRSRCGVRVGVGDLSSRPVVFNLRSCHLHGLGDALMGLGEGGAGVADLDGHEFHLTQ